MPTQPDTRQFFFLSADVCDLQLLKLISFLWCFLLPNRLKEAGTVASGSAHLLPILPQSTNPQQVSERRLLNFKKHFNLQWIFPLCLHGILNILCVYRPLCAPSQEWPSLRCWQHQSVRVWRLQPWLWGGWRGRKRRLPAFSGTLEVSFRHSHLAAGPHRRLHAHRAGIHVRYGLRASVRIASSTHSHHFLLRVICLIALTVDRPALLNR